MWKSPVSSGNGSQGDPKPQGISVIFFGVSCLGPGPGPGPGPGLGPGPYIYIYIYIYTFGGCIYYIYI